MASLLAGLTTTAGLGLAKSAGQFLGREKNVLVKLENPSKPLFLTDGELKKEVCGSKRETDPNKKPKQNKSKKVIRTDSKDSTKELLKLMNELKKKKSKKKVKQRSKRKSNLERLLERLD